MERFHVSILYRVGVTQVCAIPWRVEAVLQQHLSLTHASCDPEVLILPCYLYNVTPPLKLSSEKGHKLVKPLRHMKGAKGDVTVISKGHVPPSHPSPLLPGVITSPQFPGHEPSRPSSCLVSPPSALSNSVSSRFFCFCSHRHQPNLGPAPPHSVLLRSAWKSITKAIFLCHFLH